jgi:hypothetical protein
LRYQPDSLAGVVFIPRERYLLDEGSGKELCGLASLLKLSSGICLLNCRNGLLGETAQATYMRCSLREPRGDGTGRCESAVSIVVHRTVREHCDVRATLASGRRPPIDV